MKSDLRSVKFKLCSFNYEVKNMNYLLFINHTSQFLFHSLYFALPCYDFTHHSLDFALKASPRRSFMYTFLWKKNNSDKLCSFLSVCLSVCLLCSQRSIFIFYQMSRDMGFPTMWSKMTFSLFCNFKNYGLSRFKFHFNMSDITIDNSAEKMIPTDSFDVMKIFATST